MGTKSVPWEAWWEPWQRLERGKRPGCCHFDLPEFQQQETLWSEHCWHGPWLGQLKAYNRMSCTACLHYSQLLCQGFGLCYVTSKIIINRLNTLSSKRRSYEDCWQMRGTRQLTREVHWLLLHNAHPPYCSVILLHNIVQECNGGKHGGATPP